MIRRTLAMMALAMPAYAQQDTVALPQGCTAFVTIQYNSCSVSHHFTCEGDEAGIQRRIDLDPDGITYIGAIDAETQWIESVHVRSGHMERLEDAPADRASFTELLENGIDTFDFQTLSDEIGTSRYVGFDSLTGVQVEIDGVLLDQTQNQIFGYDADGELTWQGEGNEYISRDFRMFLSGTSSVTVPEGTFEIVDEPVEFIFPDESGFLSSNPKHGCGATDSSFPVLGH